MFYTECRMMVHPKCVNSVSLTCEADQQLEANDDNDSAFDECGNYTTAKNKTIVQETKLAVSSNVSLLCMFCEKL